MATRSGYTIKCKVTRVGKSRSTTRRRKVTGTRRRRATTTRRRRALPGRKANGQFKRGHR